MKGFLSAKLNKQEQRCGVYVPFKGISMVLPNYSHSAAMSRNFKINKKLDVYILEGYGAFINNANAKIDLSNLNDANDGFGCNPYAKIRKMMSQGYEIVIGPAFPNDQGKIDSNLVGLFCANYVEMAEKLAEKDNENTSEVSV